MTPWDARFPHCVKFTLQDAEIGPYFAYANREAGQKGRQWESKWCGLHEMCFCFEDRSASDLFVVSIRLEKISDSQPLEYPNSNSL